MIVTYEMKQLLAPGFSGFLVLPFPYIDYLLGEQMSERCFLLSLDNFSLGEWLLGERPKLRRTQI